MSHCYAYFKNCTTAIHLHICTYTTNFQFFPRAFSSAISYTFSRSMNAAFNSSFCNIFFCTSSQRNLIYISSTFPITSLLFTNFALCYLLHHLNYNFPIHFDMLNKLLPQVFYAFIFVQRHCHNCPAMWYPSTYSMHSFCYYITSIFQHFCCYPIHSSGLFLFLTCLYLISFPLWILFPVSEFFLLLSITIHDGTASFPSFGAISSLKYSFR